MKTYKQFAEQEGVRRVDFVDGITGEKETMNEILPAIAGVARAAVGAAKVAGGVGKKAVKTVKKVAKPIVKKAGKVAADQAIKYRDKQKPQAKKDRDAMGRRESVEEDTDQTEEQPENSTEGEENSENAKVGE